LLRTPVAYKCTDFVPLWRTRLWLFPFARSVARLSRHIDFISFGPTLTGVHSICRFVMRVQPSSSSSFQIKKNSLNARRTNCNGCSLSRYSWKRTIVFRRRRFDLGQGRDGSRKGKRNDNGIRAKDNRH